MSQAQDANPFLDAPDGKPVTADFKGTEWNDEWGAEELPISVRVKTTRLAAMKWGAVFRISFETVASKATQKREIQPLHFVVTNDKVFLLNEADMSEATRKLAEMENAPAFEKSDVRALSHGKQELNENSTTELVTAKGDYCAYNYRHTSGHFTTIAWRKGHGLIEYGQGYGARKDGFSLTRESTSAGKAKQS